VIQQAVAQLDARLDQRAPGLLAAHAVATQASFLLERPDGLLGSRSVAADIVAGRFIPEGAQAALEIAYRLA
jgi:hypothetical protein